MGKYSRTKIAQILSAGAAASTTTAKGSACEDLGVYLFEKFAGVSLVYRDELDAFNAAETDLIFTNNGNKSGLHFIEPVLIVECKNYARNVGSSDITYFAARLRQKGARVGVLLTTTEVSGSTGFSGVHALEAALHDGVTILVIDTHVINAIESTEELVQLLMNQMIEFRAHGTFAALGAR